MKPNWHIKTETCFPVYVMRVLQILQPMKIKAFALTALDKQDKLAVPYSLRAGLVNSGQLPAVNCVLCEW